MATAYSERVPTWFWIVAGLAVLWAAAGCFAYLSQVYMTDAQMAALPEGQRTLIESMPAWATGAYGIATWGGLLGAIALLMRRRWARPLFLVSLIAVLTQFGWVFLVGRAGELIGPSAYPLPVAIIVIAALLLWFAAMAEKRGWLR